MARLGRLVRQNGDANIAWTALKPACPFWENLKHKFTFAEEMR